MGRRTLGPHKGPELAALAPAKQRSQAIGQRPAPVRLIVQGMQAYGPGTPFRSALFGAGRHA